MIDKSNNGNGLRLWWLGLALLSAGVPALAQTNQNNQKGQDRDEVLEEIVVHGDREVMRSSIASKRNQTVVADAVSSDDIGNLPATSLGEVMVSIPGVAITRLKGGVSEVAIRGLGPFLSATQFNGRPASNGSGDRSVNFGMFPSEMANIVTVQGLNLTDEPRLDSMPVIGNVREVQMYGELYYLGVKVRF